MRIEVKELTHIYSEGMPYETKALDSVSFTAQPGEFLAVMGHTGSGKSTLLQHLNGLLKPAGGQVLADGIDINDKTDEAKTMRRRIGMVFQYPEYQLFEETVIKDVCFGPANMGLDEAECLRRADNALRLVGIDPEVKGQSSPFLLSGGEKRRVAIAGVLAMEPEALILDEPTAGLDPRGRRDILGMIERIRADRKLTILLVSHSMDDVAALATHVLVMDRGRLVMDGTPREIFSRGAELSAIGLSRPTSAQFMEMLASRGMDVDTDVLTSEEAEKEILKKWR